MRKTLSDLIDRFRTTTTQPMSDYMKRGNDSTDPNPWETTPFTRTAKLRGKGSDPLEEYVRKGATRIYDELQRRGELTEVRTGWFEPERTCYRASSASAFYLLEVGPIAATADGVQWSSAFRMDPETAPDHKSAEWKDHASSFELSERDAEKGIPSKISCAYSELETLTERNDVNRAVHPRELRSRGPRMSDRAFEYAMELVASFPGVEGPTDDALAWELIDESAAKSTTSDETEEGHV